jgi:hypothetical protein
VKVVLTFEDRPTAEEAFEVFMRSIDIYFLSEEQERALVSGDVVVVSREDLAVVKAELVR